MHPNNLHSALYDFTALQECTPELSEYVFVNKHQVKTIDFSDAAAVIALNKALLCHHYNIKRWNLPEDALCPPIPGRVDYIHHLADLILNKKVVHGLDIGVGANCIYPILGSQIYKWNMVGADISEDSVIMARQNATGTVTDIDIRHQTDPAYLFKNIIQEGEYFDFTMCNPPFYSSEKEALKANMNKNKNLQLKTTATRNFGGLANELWCNGGEALFIKRMIKQSVPFKKQVGVFTTLVSRNEHLPKLIKLLTKLKASHAIIEMQLGNKKSRILTWKFNS
ncbi:23S rRNA (adenine(1618)-N(6))-methyltransferase RlmF [Dokdonia sp.]|uniref:23S rRNA (adenine(1618)-N(6))-methyltransferase RlmF n=1 Tax=Dokdonia sp. TaxID=2024995 RepID=UPI0032656BCE